MNEHWEEAKFIDFAELVNGRAYKQHEMLDRGTHLLRIQNLNGGGSWYYSNLELDPDKYCEAGDLLYAWSATFGPYVYDGPRAIYHYHIWKVLPRANMSREFGYHLLRRITDAVKSKAHGVAMPHMTKAGMEAWPIALPPINEQHRIATQIDALQARSRRAREALDAIPALLERFRQSVLAAAFRGDLTANWRAKHPEVEPASVLLERIRAERKARWIAANPKKAGKYVEPEPVDADKEGLPELAEGWCWARLEELISRIEAGKSPKAHGRPAMENEYGVLKVSAVSWGSFNPNENKAMMGGQLPDPADLVMKGDLLISRANTVELVGAVVLVDEDHANLMLCDKTLRLVTASSSIRKQYMLHALRSSWVRGIFEDQATGTSDSMRNLSHGKILSVPIPLPPLGEQDAIANILEQALQIASNSQNALDWVNRRLQSLDQAILAKAFRGELVPQDPNDEPASVLLDRIKAERAAQPSKPRGRRPSC